MLLYVGAEITIGGWLVTFMLNVRNGTPSASSLVASGFWIGITVGRFALGWITSYFGEKIMVSAYLVVAIGLELAFWLGKEFVVSAIMAALVGLSIGMVMPAVRIHLLSNHGRATDPGSEYQDDDQDSSGRKAYCLGWLWHSFCHIWGKHVSHLPLHSVSKSHLV
jgi:fucose permease